MKIEAKFSLKNLVFSKKGLKSKNFTKHKIFSIDIKHYSIENSIYTEILYYIDKDNKYRHLENDLILVSEIKEFIKNEKEKDIKEINKLYDDITLEASKI